jgi:DNA-directed RNA polymerase subunit M/transcription elongation factor TFIIS
MKDTKQNGTRKDWEHIHVCPKCRHILHPDEIELGSIVLGVMTCPKCEWSGPINLQIVERKDDPAS